MKSALQSMENGNPEYLSSKPYRVNGKEYEFPQRPHEEPDCEEKQSPADNEEIKIELSPLRKEEMKKAMARQIKNQLGKQE
jgi:hypothetical protein